MTARLALVLAVLAGCTITPADAAPTQTAPLSGLPAAVAVSTLPPSTSPPIVAPALAEAVAVPVSPRVVESTLPAAPIWQPAPTSVSSWPKWRTTPEGVPYYAGRGACSVDQAIVIAQAFAARGASVLTQWAMVYIASRESGCNYQAIHIGKTDDSHGTHQLNRKGNGPLSKKGILGRLGWTPELVRASLQSSAQAAADLWAVCGLGPWRAGDYSCRRPTS